MQEALLRLNMFFIEVVYQDTSNISTSLHLTGAQSVLNNK